MATEGVGRDLTLCVGLNFALSSSSSIRRSVAFLGSSIYLGNGEIPFDVCPFLGGCDCLKGLSCVMGGGEGDFGSR